MNVLIAASEFSPLARTGEFADDLRELANHLVADGHEVTVALPLYRCVREGKAVRTKKSKAKFSVPIGAAKLPCELHEGVTPEGLKLLLVARDEFFDRTGLYGADGRDYQDNAARFVFFTKCVVELARRLSPDVLHLHGWQPALAPVFAREGRLGVPTVLSPHGLDYQGNFWSYDFALTNLPGEYFSARGVEFYGSMNFLKGGILFADAVVLPSRRYVAEMQTPLFGCGLEGVLRDNAWKLEGIPAGLDASVWPVLTDVPGAKTKARAALLAAVGLPAGHRVFLADAAATRGHGISDLLAALDRLPSDEARVLLLGPVDSSDRMALEIAVRRHAARFAHREEVDAALFQSAIAGSDFLLLPGAVEPGGELVMLALRNGVIPVAASCGGLSQFVRDDDPTRDVGNGYVFHARGVSALCDAIRRAVDAAPDRHEAVMAAARASDFSWAAAARRHAELYGRLCGRSTSAAA